MGREAAAAIAIVVMLASSEAWAQAPAAKAQVVITRATGGSIQTRLSANIIVNKESGITREWIAIHDPAMPAILVGTPGVTTAYVPDRLRGEYQYQAKPSVEAKEALAAVEIRFLVFDVWAACANTPMRRDRRCRSWYYEGAVG